MVNILSPEFAAYLKNMDFWPYHEIFEADTYHLIHEEVIGRTVVDIGACMGYFSLRCIDFGAMRCIAIEAQSKNYKNLIRVVEDFPTITTVFAAADEVDNKTVYLSEEHVASKVSKDGDPVRTVSLKTIVCMLGDETDMILKIDCEGHEFNVLLNTPIEILRRFKFIHAELHQDFNMNPEYHDVRRIRSHLINTGYQLVNRISNLSFDHNIDHHLYDQPVSNEKWIRID